MLGEDHGAANADAREGVEGHLTKAGEKPVAAARIAGLCDVVHGTHMLAESKALGRFRSDMAHPHGVNPAGGVYFWLAAVAWRVQTPQTEPL